MVVKEIKNNIYPMVKRGTRAVVREKSRRDKKDFVDKDDRANFLRITIEVYC